MKTQDQITVIMPLFNGKKFLGEAIDSVWQSGAHHLIVVDDGSLDGGGKMAQERGAQVIRMDENRGQSFALNLAFEQVSTPWVGFLDQDDRYVPGSLLRLLKSSRRLSPQPLFLQGKVRALIDERGGVHPTLTSTLKHRAGDKKPPFYPLGRALIHQKLLHALRKRRGFLFDTTLQKAQDLELFLALSSANPVYGCALPVVDYRVHAENQSLIHPRSKSLTDLEMNPRAKAEYALLTQMARW